MTDLKSVSKQENKNDCSIENINFSLTDNNKISIETSLSICRVLKNSISVSTFNKKPCYNIDLNGLNILKRIKKILKRSDIFHPLDIPIETPINSYLEDIYLLLNDMLVRIVNIGDRKLKPKIKSYEDSHLYNTLQITIDCYEAIINTDKDFLLKNSSSFYKNYATINDKTIHSITKTLKRKENSSSLLTPLYTLRRGLNYKEKRIKLLYLFTYKESLYHKIIENDFKDSVLNCIQKDYLIILKGATSSFNLKHMSHCVEMIADKIKGTS